MTTLLSWRAPFRAGKERFVGCSQRDAGGGAGDEVEVVAGWQREVFGFTGGDIGQELFLVPGLVQALVDVERASVDLAEQDVDVADEESPAGKHIGVLPAQQPPD